MFQQVNLYQPIFREEHKLFSAATIFATLGAVVAALAAIALFSLWRINSLDRQLRAIRSHEVAQQKLIASANAVVGRAESPQALEDRLKTMAIDLDRRRLALRYLRGNDAGGPSAGANRGFSERLAALAREQLDGLWLTGATFTSDPGHFTLTGAAVRAELVPMYIGRLANEAAFTGTRLQSIDIRRPKQPARGEIEFTISSSAAATLAADASAPSAGGSSAALAREAAPARLVAFPADAAMAGGKP